MAPRVLFIADAAPEVGGGHVVRCLTLAAALQARGAECAFQTTPTGERVLDAFAPAGIGRVPDSQGEWTAVVVDHYGYDAARERSAARGAVLLSLDDMADRPRSADLVVNPAAGWTPDAYGGLLEPDAELLLGPSYALIRPEFGALREAALRRRAEAAPVRRILVAMGLTDVGGVTQEVVDTILPEVGAAELDVVLGASAPSLRVLQSRSEPRVNLHVETAEMARLTAEADLAIGAAGGSTWERACLGLPTVTVVLADNQRPAARAMAAAEAALALERGAPLFRDRLRSAFVQLAGDARLRSGMSAVSAALCDGAGADRVAERLLARVQRANS